MMRRASTFACLAALAAACNQTPIETPVRTFDRPSDVALTCVIYNPTAAGCTTTTTGGQSCLGLYERREMSSCASKPTMACNPDANGPDSYANPLDRTLCFWPELRALVVNSARGELALADVPNGKLTDLDPRNPGFNFVPVGRLPETVRASSDGCMAVTANVDSCDLSIVNLPTLYNTPYVISRGAPGAGDYADDVVRQVELYAGGRRIMARPTAIELTPPRNNNSDHVGTNTLCEDYVHHAWIALPGCEAVVEATLQLEKGATTPLRAEITRALHVGTDGVTQLADPSQLSCADECSGGTPPQVSSDPMAPGGLLPNTLAAPGTLALDTDGDRAQRLAIGDYYGEKVSVLTLDPRTGEPSAPRAITLESGALGVSRVRISPRTPAGKFLYAMARDGSARVIDLDRETECETNPDPQALQAVPLEDPLLDARRLGCFPLGDPSTPRRSANAVGPGIAVPGGALARDIAFVHLDVPPPPTTGLPLTATPQLLVGDFAWLVGSDGRAHVVQLYDACPQPNEPQDPDGDGVYTAACALGNALPSRQASYNQNFGHPFPIELERMAHRIRAGSLRFFRPNSAGDAAGTPRIQDEVAPLTITVAGSPAQAAIGGRLPILEPVSRKIDSLLQSPPAPDAGYTQWLEVPEPRLARDETWNLAWEGVLPGTSRAFGRVCGVIDVDDNGQRRTVDDPTCPRGSLVDSGANYCSHDVVTGDKVELLGCASDDDCVFTQECVHDKSAPPDITRGLCLDRDSSTDLVARCGPLLRSSKRYRITAPRQGVKLSSGQVTDLVELAEIYEPEYSSQTRECDISKVFAPGETDTECGSVVIPSPAGGKPLATTCLRDFDGVPRCLRACNPTGEGDLAICGAGYLCAETSSSQNGSDYRCMRAPRDIGLFTDCLKQPQQYHVRVGGGFSVVGSISGLISDLQPNPVTRVCEAPPVSEERVRLRSPRIPLDAPLCTLPLDPATGIDAVSYQGTGPNACRFEAGNDLLLHFENTLLAFALRLPPNGNGFVPEDDTNMAFGVAGGGFPLGLVLGVGRDPPAQAPRTAVTAPDRQTVFIVDEGKGTTSTSLRGQLLRLISSAQICDPAFVVR